MLKHFQIGRGISYNLQFTSSVMCQNDRCIFDFRLQLINFIYGSKWAHNATTVMDSLAKTKLRIIIEIYVLSMT